MNVYQKRRATIIEEERESDRFQDEDRLSTIIDTETSSLTPEQIEEFFKATEDGSIERLERLFNERKNADPNMTRFNESLLMAAIRRQRPEVAEYLIDQLAVDVKYAADLHEFRVRTKAPVRERTFSCRDLAYEKGMMELVDLIDITNDEVTPTIKRYLQKRLQSRLDNIHQSYIKHSKDPNKYVPLQPNDEKSSRQSPITSVTDEKASLSPTLPSIQRSCKSRIDEVVQSIDTTKDKSIDETGKKTFRFTNYNLRFRLVEKNAKNNKTKEPPSTKTRIPTLPIIPLTASPLPPLILPNSNRRSFSETSTRLSTRDTCLSVCHSIRKPSIPQIVSTEYKPPITTTPKYLLPKRVTQNTIKQSYIPQEQETLYSPPRRLVPVTLKATAMGLPSDSRIIRD